MSAPYSEEQCALANDAGMIQWILEHSTEILTHAPDMAIFSVSGRLMSKLFAALAALRDVEWSGNHYEGHMLKWRSTCPSCGRRQEQGHDDDCVLASALTPFAGFKPKGE